ncbi:MAG: ComEC/Rec2 family competence protein [Treponema sp.]|nr:ComEC/Rec2 family competence protein [Treponema sp.]
MSPPALESRPFYPILYTALGMGLSYYGGALLPFHWAAALLTGFLVFSVILLSFFVTLSFLPFDSPPPLVLRSALALGAGVLGLALGFGPGRGTQNLALGLYPDRIQAIQGVLLEDPRTLQGGSGLGTLELSHSYGQGGLRASARGRLRVFFPPQALPQLREFGRGAFIYVEGTLSEGSQGPAFNARSLHVQNPAPALEQFRSRVRMGLLGLFQREGQTPPWGALASALLLGVRDDLDADLALAFRNAGSSHILALSGMHLAVITGLLALILKKPLGAPRAALAGALFILFYVFIVGPQPSLVRALIMYLIGCIALWGFLKPHLLSLLAMSFIIQILVQHDSGLSVSFILSYLALLGILVLGTRIQALFKGRVPALVSASLGASLGAFLFSAPVVAYYFGTLRPIGILAGLALAPLSTIFMILAILSLGLGAAGVSLLDPLMELLYGLIGTLASLGARAPGIYTPRPLLVLAVCLFVYTLIHLLSLWDQKQRNKLAAFA